MKFMMSLLTTFTLVRYGKCFTSCRITQTPRYVVRRPFNDNNRYLARSCTVRIGQQQQQQAYFLSTNRPTTQKQTHLAAVSSSSSSFESNHDSSSRSSKSTTTTLEPMKINLLTIEEEELGILVQNWGYPQYRSKQIIDWVRTKGVTDVKDMVNLPKDLRAVLKQHAVIGSLKIAYEQISQKDGTIKRAYELYDGNIIESVLMPYEDGRYTACISSQVGCAMGCVFCATGQMGFTRQLSANEIYEQVAIYDSLLKSSSSAPDDDKKNNKQQRVTNIVFMGMGEPLANYKNVMSAVQRINQDLKIGARKITISTVGVVPKIKQLMKEHIQVKLAISLHCSTEEERNALIPANKRYGGLYELMHAVKEYTETTKRRISFEWALIDNENDKPEVAHSLGDLLINQIQLRKDYIHINVIPLNPTNGYSQGSPSSRQRVNTFINILEKEYGISTTPRVRRGIDIDAGCGQLKSKVDLENEKRKKKTKQTLSSNENDDDDNNNDIRIPNENSNSQEHKPYLEKNLQDFMPKSSSSQPVVVGVYEDDDEDEEEYKDKPNNNIPQETFITSETTIDIDNDDFEDEEWDSITAQNEIDRLLNLVSGTTIPVVGSNEDEDEDENEDENERITTIKIKNNKESTSENMINNTKKRRKKLIRNLKQISKLKDITVLNDEQKLKISKEREWRKELETIEEQLKCC